MNLDEAQKQQVAAWVAQGLKLSEIQNRLASELGVRLTYMEMRFLLDDLQVIPKDQPASQAPKALGATKEAAQRPRADAEETLEEGVLDAEPLPAGGGRVSVTVDQLARPGAIVSGRVTFSDGKTSAWHLDQFGRLGLAPTEQGYRPSADDLQEFQILLQSELQKLGY